MRPPRPTPTSSPNLAVVIELIMIYVPIMALLLKDVVLVKDEYTHMQTRINVPTAKAVYVDPCIAFVSHTQINIILRQIKTKRWSR